MKIVFMGSPSFAVPALQKLLDDNEHEVTCVYTKVPRPSGRGNKVNKMPIHLLAEKYNIPVLTPLSLKNETIKHEADIIAVAAYGILLPTPILDSVKYGCINIHPSLLPRWRGAAPIQHTILAGDKKTAVCIMKMTEKLDAGDILSQQEVEVQESDNYQILHDKLAEIGASLLIDVIDNIQTIKPIPQDAEGLTYASKIKKELIDWNNSALDIYRRIKALMGADCILNNKRIKILQVRYSSAAHSKNPGEFINDKLHIACGNGIIIPQTLQISGKKATSIEEFLRGNSLSKNN